MSTKEYRKTKDLKLWEQNPRSIRKEDFERLKKQIQELGQYKPLIITKDGEVIGGNMRLRAYRELGIEDVWVSVVDPKDDMEKLKYALSDNDRAGYYDDDLLANLSSAFPDFEWSDYAVDLTPPETLDKVLFKEEVQEDEVPEVSDKEPISKLGEVYQLGRHRIMCGDSTKIEDVEKLMNGQKADLVFTDPPYGMKKENEGVINDNLNYDDLLEFNKEWIPLSFMMLKDNGSWYCWGTDEPLMDIYSNILKPYIKTQKATFRNLITWNKSYLKNGNTFNPFGASGSDELRSYPLADEKCLFVMCGVQGFNNNSDNYYEGWEPIRSYLEKEAKKVGLTPQQVQEITGVGMYGHWFTKSQWTLIPENHYKALQDAFKKDYDAFKKDYDELKKEFYSTRAYFENSDEANNVWNIEITKGDEKREASGHATPKPIELCARGIKSSCPENGLTIDFFLGSGSTLIACEQTNRTCYGMEIDPKYCDVIRKRYARFIGKEDEWEKVSPKVQ